MSATCPGCDRSLPPDARYCPSCGEDVGAGTPTLRRWLAETAGDLFAVEGQLPRTLRALVTWPGRLTIEWAAGRRARWVKPFRLYLFCSLAFFTISLVFPVFAPTLEHDELANPVAFVEDAAVDREAREMAPVVFFFLMPFFAALLKAAFRKQRPYYLEHLVHSIHLHAYAFLVLAVAWPLDGLPEPASTLVGSLLLAAVFIYLIVSVKRVYAVKWWRAIPSSLLLSLVHLAVAALALVMTGDIRASMDVSLERGEALHAEAVEALAAGDTAAARKKEAEAVIQFLESPRFPYDPHARYHLGRLLLDAGQPDDAATEAAQGLALRPPLRPDSVLLLGLGAEAADSLGRAEEAAGFRRRLLEARVAEPSGERPEYGGRHAAELAAYEARAEAALRGDAADGAGGAGPAGEANEAPLRP